MTALLAQDSGSYLDSFWDFLWLILVSFAFIAYLILLFLIVADLFRNRAINGWSKAAWVVFLFLFPVLTALVYLVVHGDGMADRAQRQARSEQQAEEAYIRQVAGNSPVDQIASAKALLDSGAITQDEFDSLKARALGQ